MVNNNTELLVKSIAEGSTSVEITDVLSKKSVKLEILVLSKVTAQDYELSEDKKTLTKWKNTTTKALDMNTIEELKGVTSIEKDAFRGNESIEFVIFNNNLTSIGNRVFYNCKNLKEVRIPDSVTTLGGASFSGCENLEKVNLPKGLTSIEAVTLYNCHKVTEIIIPEGVTKIDWNAFSGTGVKELVFPASIESLDTNVVAFCKKLEKMTFKGNTPPSIKYNSLRRNVEEPTLKIYVPKGKKQTYIESSRYWKDFEDFIEEF